MPACTNLVGPPSNEFLHRSTEAMRWSVSRRRTLRRCVRQLGTVSVFSHLQAVCVLNSTVVASLFFASPCMLCRRRRPACVLDIRGSGASQHQFAEPHSSRCVNDRRLLGWVTLGEPWAVFCRLGCECGDSVAACLIRGWETRAGNYGRCLGGILSLCPAGESATMLASISVEQDPPIV